MTLSETIEPMDVDEELLPGSTTIETEEDEELIAKVEGQLEEALALPAGALQIPFFLSILQESAATPRILQLKERAVYDLARAYCAASDYERVVGMFAGDLLLAFLQTITKAKTAKVVRQVLDIVCAAAPTQYSVQESVARSILNWTEQEKRSFLRQRVEAKLASMLFCQQRYVEALTLCDRLLHELKKLDDKQLLVETHLLESKIHFALCNIPRAKAALTASRTAANAIYVGPHLQAEMDSTSGAIHTEEGDYNTAHSYFLEAFEQLDQMNNEAEAMVALKYMMLCKILDSLRKALKLSSGGLVGASSADNDVDVSAMLSGRQSVKYAGKDIEAMTAIAKTASRRNLKEFQALLVTYHEQLQQDLLIKHHLHILQEQLLESNLIRIIEPYSCVELDHVAKLIDMPLVVVEKKLSQMILDGKFQGILDQGKGQLVVYEESQKDEAMEKGLQVIANMDAVVTSLFERSKALRTMMI
jgi:26S proteasome regulatory subunit N6